MQLHGKQFELSHAEALNACMAERIDADLTSIVYALEEAIQRRGHYEAIAEVAPTPAEKEDAKAGIRIMTWRIGIYDQARMQLPVVIPAGHNTGSYATQGIEELTQYLEDK